MKASHRSAVARALDAGSQFAGLHTSGANIHVVLVSPDGTLVVESAALDDGGRTPSIVDLAPAAAWDEREAADLYGVRFDGHEPLRPLVDHSGGLDRWTVPVRSDDTYQVAVGPIHAGVIESGHFRFHVVGDRILHLDARLFYKHRGLERAAEGRPLRDVIAYAQRACAACAVTNTVAYALAAEDALGLLPTAELARARTILLELERTWNHLNDIAAICSGVGLAAGNMHFAALTDRVRALNARLTGHRFLFGTVAVGGSGLTLDAADVTYARDELAELRAAARRGWRELLFNASFQDRLPDIGVVSAEDARSLGAVGPAARASGIAADARTSSPRLAYDGFAVQLADGAAGDVQARLEQRALELWQSFDLLEAQLDGPLAPATAEPRGTEKPLGLARVESPRGATLCAVEHSHGTLERLRLRTGSYANWPVVAHAAAGNLLPDFPLVNKSFELCYACADR